MTVPQVNLPSPRWILESSVLAMHDEQIAEHGGLAGIRDLPLLQSALARPQNLEAYGSPDIADLAAAYAFGIARNHAFLDGNKRTAWVVAETFLLKNGYELIASDRDGVTAMLSVADGTMSEPEFAIWLRTYARPRKTP
jgi:death-on-curing protein